MKIFCTLLSILVFPLSAGATIFSYDLPSLVGSYAANTHSGSSASEGYLGEENYLSIDPSIDSLSGIRFEFSGSVSFPIYNDLSSTDILFNGGVNDTALNEFGWAAGVGWGYNIAQTSYHNEAILSQGRSIFYDYDINQYGEFTASFIYNTDPLLHPVASNEFITRMVFMLPQGYYDSFESYGYVNVESVRLSLSTVDPIYPTSVPEPASLALMGLGLAGLGFARRKKAV